MTIQVQKMDHVAINVTDVPRAKAFYGGLLGLREVERPASFDFGGAWYRLGNIDLHLVQRPERDGESRRHLCFFVGDVQGAAREIEVGGHPVQWDTRYKIDGVDRFFTLDPDGNRVEFQGTEARS